MSKTDPGDCQHCRAKFRYGQVAFQLGSRKWCEYHKDFAPEKSERTIVRKEKVSR